MITLVQTKRDKITKHMTLKKDNKVEASYFQLIFLVGKKLNYLTLIVDNNTMKSYITVF